VVYLVSPCNQTIEFMPREQIRRAEMIRLVPELPNLIVTRSFSFGYGLAGARVGYLAGPPPLVALLQAKETSYRLGTLQERLALAALEASDAHIDRVSRYLTEQRALVSAALREDPGVRVYESDCNQLFCEFLDAGDGAWFGRRPALAPVARRLARALELVRGRPAGGAPAPSAGRAAPMA
jgi:histidinol-phosphate/aromatic aminotransferase/cobyric acid decarboxylase-like protein